MLEAVNGIEKKGTDRRKFKRHPYQQIAKSNLVSRIDEIQILDISEAGLRFTSPHPIQSKNSVKIIWEDEKLGEFSVIIQIARRVPQPQGLDFQHCYGSQFVSVGHETRQKLGTLFVEISQKQIKDFKNKIEEMTFLYFLESIEKGRIFLNALLKGKEKTLCFNTFLKEVRPYERKSYEHTDLVSLLLQRITVHNFHCNIMKMLLLFVNENPKWQSKFFQQTIQKINTIADVKKESDQMLKTIESSKESETVKKDQIQMVTESSNRVFYNRSELITAFSQASASIRPAPRKADRHLQ